MERPFLLTILDTRVKVLIARSWYERLIDATERSVIHKSIHTLLLEAKTKGSLVVVDMDSSLLREIPEDVQEHLKSVQSRIGVERASTVVLASWVKSVHREDEVYVTTTDGDVIDESTKCQILTYLPFGADKIAAEGTLRDAELKSLAGKFHRLTHLVTLAFPIIAGLLAWSLKPIFTWALSSINVWGIIVGIVIVSIVMYWFRSRQRLAYGSSEFVFGVVLAIRVFIPDFDIRDLQTASILQLLGSVYVMVRGLDNIGMGLIGLGHKSAWQRIFGKSAD